MVINSTVLQVIKNIAKTVDEFRFNRSSLNKEGISMNREQRRNMSKKNEGALRYLQTPCTITEATQIARGVAEDVVAEYSQQNSPLQVAISLQVEILKEVVIRIFFEMRYAQERN